MVGTDERLRYQHPILPVKGKCSRRYFNSEGNRKVECDNYGTKMFTQRGGGIGVESGHSWNRGPMCNDYRGANNPIRNQI